MTTKTTKNRRITSILEAKIKSQYPGISLVYRVTRVTTADGLTAILYIAAANKLNVIYDEIKFPEHTETSIFRVEMPNIKDTESVAKRVKPDEIMLVDSGITRDMVDKVSIMLSRIAISTYERRDYNDTIANTSRTNHINYGLRSDVLRTLVEEYQASQYVSKLQCIEHGIYQTMTQEEKEKLQANITNHTVIPLGNIALVTIEGVSLPSETDTSKYRITITKVIYNQDSIISLDSDMSFAFKHKQHIVNFNIEKAGYIGKYIAVINGTKITLIDAININGVDIYMGLPYSHRLVKCIQTIDALKHTHPDYQAFDTDEHTFEMPMFENGPIPTNIPSLLQPCIYFGINKNSIYDGTEASYHVMVKIE